MEDGEAAGSAVGDAPTEVGGPGRGVGDETAILGGEEGMEGISPHQRSRSSGGLQQDSDSINSRSSGEGPYVRGRRPGDGDASDDSGSGSGRRGVNGTSGGPMTPRNDIGPFVFDGAASRRPRDSDEAHVVSRLDAAPPL